MSMFAAFNISASGMTAQQLRTDVISQNIAMLILQEQVTEQHMLRSRLYLQKRLLHQVWLEGQFIHHQEQHLQMR